jgi:hypothetical protein
MNRYF